MSNEITIIADTLGNVDFAPASTHKEIIQNVKTIITTPKYSVPLDRNFGIMCKFVDAPLPVAKAKAISEIVEAINTYEPRVEVVKVSFNGDGKDGVLTPTVRIRIKE